MTETDKNTIESKVNSPTYSRYWVNEENLNKLLSSFKNKDNLEFLEIGSFEGGSANYLVDTFLRGKNSVITCVDPWIKYSESTLANFQGRDEHMNEETYGLFIKNIAKNADKINVIRGLSVNALPKMPSEHFDFVLVDGDHSEKAVMQDALMSFRITKVGGFILFDDYLWQSEGETPKTAIDEFIQSHSHALEVVFQNYQLAVKKLASVE